MTQAHSAVLGAGGAAMIFAVTAFPASAIDVAISTANPASVALVPNGSFNIGTGHAVAFDSDDRTSATLLVDVEANLKAFHIRENGNYLISGNTGSTFGSNSVFVR